MDTVNSLLNLPHLPLPPLYSICDRWTTFKFSLIFTSAFFDHYFQALLFVQRLLKYHYMQPQILYETEILCVPAKYDKFLLSMF